MKGRYRNRTTDAIVLAMPCEAMLGAWPSWVIELSRAKVIRWLHHHHGDYVTVPPDGLGIGPTTGRGDDMLVYDPTAQKVTIWGAAFFRAFYKEMSDEPS